MSDDTPLSIESAVELMTVSPEGGETPPDDKQTPAAPEGGETPPAPEGAADADPNTPPDDAGETKDGDVDPVDALPTIDPPSSWKAEEKSGWESLPRNVQEAIARREQDRTTELRNLQNSTADQRKAADAEVTRLKGLADAITTHVNDKVAELARDFPEVKSEADMVALSQRDPARFATFQARMMQIQAAAHARTQAQQEVGQREQAQRQEFLTKAKDALVEAFPAWKDGTVARREMTELQDYAISQGVPEAQARNTIDANVYKLAQKAMLYDRAQAAKAAALKKTPPNVIKPGTQAANPKGDAKEAARRAQWGKLEKSGDLEDAVALLTM